MPYGELYPGCEAAAIVNWEAWRKCSSCGFGEFRASKGADPRRRVEPPVRWEPGQVSVAGLSR